MKELLRKIDALEARIREVEPNIHAYLPEPNRFERLRREAAELAVRFPDPADRPPLFGLLAGVKDIFHVDGFETRAGSRLPPEALAGAESTAVSLLKAAGVLIAGKTVTTEFAYFGPGPTGNPRNPTHTPGGSSSGSAAAAAAGLCDFALGTQTIGSINRPAAFCGVVGFKPSFDRIPTDGVIPLAPTFDHAGVLAADLQIAEKTAAALCRGWEPNLASGKPRLGEPVGEYLDHAGAEARAHFNQFTDALESAGFVLKKIPLMPDFERIRDRHYKILAFEAARVHRAWYDAYADRYHEKTRALIDEGLRIAEEEYHGLVEEAQRFRTGMQAAMIEHEIDAWITPSAPGTAPAGLESTGDPVMNLPWTQAGLPALTIPTGAGSNGLPLGTQVVGRWHRDEALFHGCRSILDAWVAKP